MFWSTNQDLANPQSLNSYAYANDNPIVNKDPDGKCAGPAIALLPICIGAVLGIAETQATNPDANTAQLLTGAIGGATQGAVAEGRAVASAIVGTVAFTTSLIQDFAGGKDLDFKGAFMNGASSALGLSMFKTAKSGVGIITGQIPNEAMLNSKIQIGNSILGGITQSAYSIYGQNAFKLPSNQSSNQNSQTTSLTNLISAFRSTNGFQIQAIKDVISAFKIQNR